MDYCNSLLYKPFTNVHNLLSRLSVVGHSLQLSVTFLKSIKILRNYRRIRNSVF